MRSLISDTDMKLSAQVDCDQSGPILDKKKILYWRSFDANAHGFLRLSLKETETFVVSIKGCKDV